MWLIYLLCAASICLGAASIITQLKREEMEAVIDLTIPTCMHCKAYEPDANPENDFGFCPIIAGDVNENSGCDRWLGL